MRSASVAEWVLGRFTPRSRAASTVGDLLEASHHQGMVWFWLSVAAILLSLAWRRSLAFAAALCLGLFSFGALQNFIYGLNAAHRPPHEWIPLFRFLNVIGILLCFGMPYTTIRYGLKDPFTQQILSFWGLVSIFILYWWIPLVPAACAVLAVSGFVYAAMSAPQRRSLVAFVVALSFSFAGAALFSRYLTSRLYQVSAMPSLSHTPLIWHFLKQLAAGTFFLGWLIQPSIYSRVHQMFFGEGSGEGAKQATV